MIRGKAFWCTVLAVCLGLTPLALPAVAANSPFVYLEYDNASESYRVTYLAPGSASNELNDLRSIGRPSLSPDGSKVAFSVGLSQASSGLYAIYTANTNGSGLTQITSGNFGQLDPTWSADGQTIFFSRNTSGSLNQSTCCSLARVGSAGGAIVNLTASVGAIHPAASPDGALVAYETPAGAYTIPASGGTATLRASNGKYPTFSPDSSTLAYILYGSTDSLVVRPLGGSPTTIYSTTRTIESPQWVGDQIWFIEYDGFGYDSRTNVQLKRVSSSGGSAVTDLLLGRAAELSTSNQSVITDLVGNYDRSGGDDMASFGPGGVWDVGISTSSSFGFTNWADFFTATGWASHLAGDYNGDGRTDIANFHPSNDTWHVSQSSGTGFDTTAWVDYSGERSWTTQIAGDFSGDGVDDVAGFDTNDGTWSVGTSSGSSFTTSTWVNYGTNSGWSSQLAGDFNGDGSTDIANFHPSNGTWHVSLSTGTSFTTSVWADYTTNSGWSRQVVGDFDGDGKDDIANYYPGNGTWWISRSTGTNFATSMWADYTTNSGWTSQVVGDFTSDGLDDIANYYPGNGTWWISRSTGSNFTTTLWATR